MTNIEYYGFKNLYKKITGGFFEIFEDNKHVVLEVYYRSKHGEDQVVYKNIYNSDYDNPLEEFAKWLISEKKIKPYMGTWLVNYNDQNKELYKMKHAKI